MAFKFNFCLEPDDEEHPGPCAPAGGKSSSNQDSAPVAREIPVLPFHREAIQHITPTIHSIPDSGTKLKYISGQQFYDVATTTSVGMELESLFALSDSKHSDLIPGVYEGGLKVWECALDLVQYLSESNVSFAGKSVMELGCGTGLPGTYSLIKGAKSVHFQDYNPEVIEYVTILNMMLNVEKQRLQEMEKRVRFFCGDWSALSPMLLENSLYDIILTSETIYSLESQPKLVAVLKQLSRHDGGVVYVAAKSFYFGVGGGVESFCRLLEADGTFRATMCRVVQASVPRIILKLTHTGTVN